MYPFRVIAKRDPCHYYKLNFWNWTDKDQRYWNEKERGKGEIKSLSHSGITIELNSVGTWRVREHHVLSFVIQIYELYGIPNYIK